MPQSRERGTQLLEEKIVCPLCGCRFLKGEKSLCSQCPLNYGKCNFEKCPHCGYDVPQSSQFISLLSDIKQYIKGAWKR
ncbi:MAG: hypothetical protein A2Z88_02995 [Omnitrophica WOR_2 bacterium GWA2_47_8]|nr:MAG: hypothetical protein A2Z88_02995 [Omnitrophica WOR_2 bacterium GWA2_47_8]